MLKIEGVKKIRKLTWGEIEEGMILLGGVTINGRIPEQLKGFPVLTRGLLNSVRDRYRLLGHREIVVAECLPGINSRKLSMQIKQNYEILKKINIFRQEFLKHKQRIYPRLGLDLASPLINSNYVEQAHLLGSNCNSFEFPAGKLNRGYRIPSFLSALHLNLTIGELLTNQLGRKFNLPEERELLLHLVIDQSAAMKTPGRMEAVVSAVNFFTRYIREFLPGINLKYYAYSTECRPINYPVSGHEMRSGEVNYTTYIKKVLHHKNTEVHNKVILFTSGLPTDQQEAYRLARLFKKNRIDNTRIILGSSENTYPEHSRFTEACSGNQVILREDCLADILAVECFDRYLGLMSLAFSKETLPDPSKVIFAPKKQEEKKKLYQFPGGKVKKVVKWTDWYKDKKK